MAFKVVLHRETDGGYWAEVPQLKGCYSQGNSREDVLQNVQEAIELYLETVGAYKPKEMKANEVEIDTVLVGA
jgi:predicted RNase H-like HicB family nuclease